jgi:glutamine synthetase
MTEDEIDQAGIVSLPTTLKEAIQVFDGSSLAKKVLGETMHDSYSRYKHDEWNRYHQHISEWEIGEYLRFY